MSTSIAHHRACISGFRDEDFRPADLARDLIVVKGNQPPTQIGSILTGDAQLTDPTKRRRIVPAVQCLTVTVVAISAHLSPEAAALVQELDLQPGDVLVPVNGLFDQLYGDVYACGRLPLCVYTVLERAPRARAEAA